MVKRSESKKKKEKKVHLTHLPPPPLLHSAAQLVELRTCRSGENVTNPISKRQPSAELENPSSLPSSPPPFLWCVNKLLFHLCRSDVAGDPLKETSPVRRRHRRRCCRHRQRCPEKDDAALRLIDIDNNSER